MKSLLSLTALFLSVLAAPSSDSTLTEWNEYKAAYDKFYHTPEEDARRLETYLANKRKVDEHNSRYQRGETTYEMAINKFSDWFPEELDRLNGLKINGLEKKGQIYERQPYAVVPDSINWVEKGAVTPVKDQGKCGSCYAFSAAGALEGLMFRTNKTITPLSVQELVDCSYFNHGCNGGYMEFCFLYTKCSGIESETSYPYEAQNDKCRAKRDKNVMSCDWFVDIQMGDEEALKEAVGLVGPVSMAVALTHQFSKYRRGIYDGSCNEFINHAMLVVGYGTDEKTGQDYWLVKNSWGADWGENGYVKMRRNINQCFIADFATYPTLGNS